MTSPALELRGVRRDFGELRAVDDVSLTVTAGSRHALIGPNGAGKSTLFALVAGTIPVTSGRILLGGEDVTSMREHRRVPRGVARTFQHSTLFLSLPAVDNVLLAVQRREGQSWSMVPAGRRRVPLREEAHDLLRQVGLEDRWAAAAGSLSHGERRQLEVAVTLACRPKVLLLDEPGAGMSAAETAALTRMLVGLPREVTLLLVEHDLDLVFDVAEAVSVLHLGRLLMTGSPEEVRASAEVQTAYLGAADTSDLFSATPRAQP